MNVPLPQMNVYPAQMNVPLPQMNMYPSQMNVPLSQMNMHPAQMNVPLPQMNMYPSQMNVYTSQMNVYTSQMNVFQQVESGEPKPVTTSVSSNRPVEEPIANEVFESVQKSRLTSSVSSSRFSTFSNDGKISHAQSNSLNRTQNLNNKRNNK
jgi:hypothetical protein